MLWSDQVAQALNHSMLCMLIPPWYFSCQLPLWISTESNGFWHNKWTQLHLHFLDGERLSFLPTLHNDPDCSPPTSSKWCPSRANVKLEVSQLRLPEQLSHSLQGKTPKELMSFTLYLTVLSKLIGSQPQHNRDTLKEVFRTCFSLPQSIQTQHCCLHLIPLCKT